MAFANTLTELAQDNPRIVFLTADFGFQLFDEFIARFGPRYVNIGVAEAQMVLTAAGLASEGWRPVTYAIASFATARCFEQIKFTVAYPHLPVLLVGGGAGFSYGASGVSHHAAEDMALLGSLPGMTVVMPGDATEVCQLLPQLLAADGPAYFSLGRGKETPFPAAEPAVLGKARLLQDGEDFAIITTGELASEAVRALEILKSRQVHPLAYQFHTVKPLDEKTLAAVAAKVRKIVVAEEHIPHGGLSSAVRRWLDQQPRHPDLVCLTAPDRFILGSPSQAAIRAECHLDGQAIANACA